MKEIWWWLGLLRAEMAIPQIPSLSFFCKFHSFLLLSYCFSSTSSFSSSSFSSCTFSSQSMLFSSSSSTFSSFSSFCYTPHHHFINNNNTSLSTPPPLSSSSSYQNNVDLKHNTCWHLSNIKWRMLRGHLIPPNYATRHIPL